MGRFEEGIANIKQALAINKNPGPFDGVFLAAEEYRKKNYRQALGILGPCRTAFTSYPRPRRSAMASSAIPRVLVRSLRNCSSRAQLRP
jgi:hypothetical protein